MIPILSLRILDGNTTITLIQRALSVSYLYIRMKLWVSGDTLQLNGTFRGKATSSLSSALGTYASIRIIDDWDCPWPWEIWRWTYTLQNTRCSWLQVQAKTLYPVI